MTLHVHTPLLESKVLSSLTGSEVYLKLECIQPPGSVKIRGIGLLCERLRDAGASRFISSSGGNGGMAVAYAGMKMGIPVTVVVPQTTTERAKRIIESYGGEVRMHGASWQEAHEFAEGMVKNGGALVHSFDHPVLWEGYASLVDEITNAGIVPDAMIVSVGGGGLYSGVVEGLRRNGLSSVRVIAVETEGTASFNAAMNQGAVVELDAIRGIATSLGAKKVAQHAFDTHRKHPTQGVTVTDSQAVSACLRFLDDHRLLVEPACGASLATLYEALPALHEFKKIVCVVCGGATVTAEQLRSYTP